MEWKKVSDGLPKHGDKCLVVYHGVAQYQVMVYLGKFEWWDEDLEEEHGPFPSDEVTDYCIIKSPNRQPAVALD